MDGNWRKAGALIGHPVLLYGQHVHYELLDDDLGAGRKTTPAWDTFSNHDRPRLLLTVCCAYAMTGNKGEAKEVRGSLRAEILFHRYLDLEKVYKLSRSLPRIYQTSKIKGIAFTKLAHR